VADQCPRVSMFVNIHKVQVGRYLRSFSIAATNELKWTELNSSIQFSSALLRRIRRP